MKKLTMLFYLCLMSQGVAQAEGPANLLILENPHRSTGIVIGDVLERRLVVESDAAHALPKSALPLKGERVNGVELVGVDLQSDQAGDKQRHLLKLRYQVFAAVSQPKVMHLPAFTLSLTGGNGSAEVQIPVWSFWYAPLVAGDIHTARSNVQPQRKPSLLNTGAERLSLVVSVLLIGLGGLVYINADRRWLPWMGGSFAQAYRKLRSLSPQNGSHTQALAYLHQAFNQVNGGTLFRRQLNEFLTQHPHFQPLAEEIDTFFQRSEALLFTPERTDTAVLIKALQQLCRRLRDCERKVA